MLPRRHQAWVTCKYSFAWSNTVVPPFRKLPHSYIILDIWLPFTARRPWTIKVCLHVACPSKPPSTFSIVPMVIDTLTARMGCTLILSIKVSVKRIKGIAKKNGDVDGTCKRSLT